MCETLRRLRVCSDMRPLLGSPIRTTVRSAYSGATAAGFAETAEAAEAAARGARKRVLAIPIPTAAGARRPDGGEADGEWRTAVASGSVASIGGILACSSRLALSLSLSLSLSRARAALSAFRCGEASGRGKWRRREGGPWMRGKGRVLEGTK